MSGEVRIVDASGRPLPVGANVPSTYAFLAASNSAAVNAGLLQAAINAMYNAGGGNVYLPAGAFSITENTVLLKPGVSIYGAKPSSTFTANNAELGETLSGGTILQGQNGGGWLLGYNTTDDNALGNSWVNTPYFAAGKRSDNTTVYANPMLSGCNFSDIGFTAAGYAFKIGAVNVPGCASCSFRNIHGTALTVAGMEFHNSSNFDIWQPVFTQCNNGIRNYASVPLLTVSPGHCTIYDPTIVITTGYTHGKSFDISALKCGNYTAGAYTDTTALLNGTRIVGHILAEVSRASTKTDTATFGTTTANITLSAGRGSDFPVGSLVTFTGGTGAFNTNFFYSRVFVVVSQVSDTIQVANTYYGSALATVGAPGTATATINNYGAPHVWATAPATGGVNNLEIQGGDVEGRTTSAYYLENTNASRMFCESWPGNRAVGITLRNSTGWQAFATASNAGVPQVDADSTSAAQGFFLGPNDNTNFNGGSSAVPTVGILYDGNRWIHQYGAGVGLQQMNCAGGNFLQPLKAIGQRVNNSDTTGASSLNEGQFGSRTYNGAGTATYTLPTVSSNALSGHLGAVYELINASGSIVTINTDGTDVFNGKTGKTSITLLPKQSVALRACQGLSAVGGSGRTTYWAIVSYVEGDSLGMGAQVVTFSTTPALDCSLGKNVTLSTTLTAGVTWGAPTNVPAQGTHITVFMQQDGTGGRAVAWNAAYIFPVAFSNTGNTAGKKTMVEFVSDGTALVAVNTNSWY